MGRGMALFWGKTKKVVTPEPYLNKFGWRASDPFVRAPWPPQSIEFALLRASEIVSASIWPKLAREYGQETSSNPIDHQRVDRDFEYDGCVTTFDGLSRVGASLHFADSYPDKLPTEHVISGVVPTFVAAVDLTARERFDPLKLAVLRDPPKDHRPEQWARPWLEVIVFDPSRSLRQHFERCLLWAAVNRATHVGYKISNSLSRGEGSSLSITDIVEGGGSMRVYFDHFAFWPKLTFGAASSYPLPEGSDGL